MLLFIVGLLHYLLSAMDVDALYRMFMAHSIQSIVVIVRSPSSVGCCFHFLGSCCFAVKPIDIGGDAFAWQKRPSRAFPVVSRGIRCNLPTSRFRSEWTRCRSVHCSVPCIEGIRSSKGKASSSSRSLAFPSLRFLSLLMQSR